MMNDKELNELLELKKEVEKLSTRIDDFLKTHSSRNLSEDEKCERPAFYGDKEKVVTEYLFKLGIPGSLSGFRYIRTAVIIILNGKKERRLYVTKNLYPEVAEYFNSTDDRVERAIRNAIHVAYKNNEKNEVLEEIVRNTKKTCPTNSEFLAFVAEKIRLES